MREPVERLKDCLRRFRPVAQPSAHRGRMHLNDLAGPIKTNFINHEAQLIRAPEPGRLKH